jgi:RimJ/RimL family protein N-acetyltransferase
LVAWVIGASWQGRGYGSEAAQALVAWLELAKVPKIRARVHPQHIASQQVARRAGLRPTAQFLDGEEVWSREDYAVPG